MERRQFIRVCTTSAANVAAAAPDASAATVPVLGALSAKPYPRSRLVSAGGATLKASQLKVNKNYVFFYPFLGTPCFLLNLGKALKAAPVKASGSIASRAAGNAAGGAAAAAHASYDWPGGAGAAKSVVAYSAICSHQLTYPTKDISFISFRAGKGGANKHADVIHCCSEHSQYDPAAGARVLAGPAPQPLAAILLEHDPAADELYATGTLGGDMFNAFFRKYEMKLTLDMGGRAREAAGDVCAVSELDNYCRQQVRC